jgi:hypothetical protein
MPKLLKSGHVSVLNSLSHIMLETDLSIYQRHVANKAYLLSQETDQLTTI